LAAQSEQLQQLMTFFRVTGEQSTRHGGDGQQRVVMPVNPVFKSGFAKPGHARQTNGKTEEEANFAPF
jgi:hypothetical protein